MFPRVSSDGHARLQPLVGEWSIEAPTAGPSCSTTSTRASCPEYKVIAVDVRPMSEEPAFTPQLTTVG